MDFYVGTFNDKKLIELSRPLYELSRPRYHQSSDGVKPSDKEILDAINRGEQKFGFYYFFANDINEAKNTAKRIGLKNFSLVSDKVYKEGIDY